MAKGYSARGGFSGGGSAMRQQQMQQKLLKMQQDMAAAQEAVENASFTASVGGGVVQATVSGKKELTALTVKPEAVDPEDVEMLQDLVVSGERGPAPGGRGHEQLHAELHRRSESSWLRTVIPGRKRKGWNRHTIKEAAGRHAVRRVCPLLLPWKTHLLGVFVIANTVFGVSIASVLFGTFCYRQRTFSARFVMAGTYFRCSLSSSIWLFDVVCDFRNIISCAFCRSCGFLALLLSSS